MRVHIRGGSNVRLQCLFFHYESGSVKGTTIKLRDLQLGVDLI